jgi:elongation factor P--(R)-beta-lysine ligase
MKRLVDRARLTAEARAFFASRGYLEVETPVVVPSPGLDLHLDAFDVGGGRYLSTSPEYQMKRLLADGHRRLFQITRAFRAGEEGERHNPEFTILEFYRAGAGVLGVMRDTEQLASRLFSVFGGGPVLSVDGQRIDVAPPFERLTVCEAFERFAGSAPEETLRLAEHDEDTFFRLLVDRVEPALARHPRAVFLTEYPAPMASLARKKPGDPRVAERFELYVAGVEVCNGFGELTDAVEQRERFAHDRAERARRGKPVYPVDEKLLAALARGMPESGGNAIGFDRLVALACGITRIADVMAFTAEEL